MLVPPGVPLFEALKPLREDLKLLGKGVEMKKAEGDNTMTTVTVKGGISCLIADHIQACENCRHIGVSALLNCRSCWVHKVYRSDHTINLLDHETTRTKEQSDMIVTQIRDLLKQKNNPTRQKRFQKMCGIRAVDNCFAGIEVDPHLQSFPDPDHFIDLGLLARFFDYVNSTLSNQQKDQVHLRFNNLESRRGWNTKLQLICTLPRKKCNPCRTCVN